MADIFSGLWRTHSYETALGEVIHRVDTDDGTEVCRCDTQERAMAIVNSKNTGIGAEYIAEQEQLWSRAHEHLKLEAEKTRRLLHQELEQYSEALEAARKKLREQTYTYT